LIKPFLSLLIPVLIVIILLFPTALAELLLRDDPLFLHFMAVALLSVEAEELERMMHESAEQAVDRLCHLRVMDESQVTTLAALASSLDHKTPRSFRPASRSRLQFPLWFLLPSVVLQ
jgi:hypothetical protein